MLNPEQSSRFVSKDELGAFIESHRRQLLSYVDRNIGPALRSRLEPEDIFQEVTIAALGSLDQFNAEGRDPFRLLCQLAEQRIIDAHRHHVAAQKRSASREVSIDAPVGSSDGFGFIDLLVASITSASQAFSKDQKEFRLQQAIAELSEEHRDILQICGGHGDQRNCRQSRQVRRRDSCFADSHSGAPAGNSENCRLIE